MAGLNFHDNLRLPSSALMRILRGVVVATQALPDPARSAARFLSQFVVVDSEDDGLTLSRWLESAAAELDEHNRHLVNLTIAIAFVQEKCRQEQNLNRVTQDMLWPIIRDALRHGSFIGPDYTPSRSAQGFLSLPLCSLIENGNIDELFRLHIWLPDGRRGVPDVAVHSHQPFAQSWILCGSGTDVTYDVSAVRDFDRATHALYAIAWSDGKGQSKTYTTKQLSSTVVNTGKLMRATESVTSVHTRGMTYNVPAAAYHTTLVSPDQLHATLFFFDARRGFEENAGVLGPKDGESNTQLRDPAGVTVRDLVEVVDRARKAEAGSALVED